MRAKEIFPMNVQFLKRRLTHLLHLGFFSLLFITCTAESFAVFDNWSSDWDLNGNAYEVVWCEAVSWREASDYARSKTWGGVYGHLVTITSAEENQFITNLLKDVFPYQAWIGGWQIPKSSEPSRGWVWVNEQGEIPYKHESIYSNWAHGEPNNTGGIEDYLTINRFGEGKWNDEGIVAVSGLIIEYEGGAGRRNPENKKPNGSLSILFDYDLDDLGYFSGDEGRIRRAALEAAGNAWSEFITDKIGPISRPSSRSVFEYTGLHPSAGTHTTLEVNMELPANTLKIFVGGRPMDWHFSVSSGGLGYGVLNESDRHILRANINRGEVGFYDDGELVQPPIDFATWGGSLSFNNLATNWHYDHRTACPNSFYDFYSHCLSGIGMILGYNNSSSRWFSIVSRNSYQGDSVALYYEERGETPPRLIGNNLSGWHERVRSLKANGPEIGLPAISSTLVSGSRKSITHLDLMGLRDIGWEVWSQFEYGNSSVPITIRPPVGKGVVLEFSAEAGVHYYIYGTENLQRWSLLDEVVGNDKHVSLFYPNNEGSYFFKAESW